MATPTPRPITPTRRAVADSRRARLTAQRSAEEGADGEHRRVGPGDPPRADEDGDPGGVDDQREDALQGVQPLEVVAQEDAEDAEQEDAEAGAEVRPVDGGDEHADPHGRPEGRRAGAPGRGQPGGQAGLGGEEGAGQEDQEGRQAAKRVLGGGQQDQRPTHAAEHPGRGEGAHAAGLAVELAPVGQRPAAVAGQEADRAGDVRLERPHAGGDQRREGDQRPAPGRRVDRPGQEAGGRREEAVPQGHPRRPSARIAAIRSDVAIWLPPAERW